MPAAHLGFPEPQGLYHPSHEHDACGVAMVADVAGRRSHDIVEKALTALCNLDHRGAQGSEPDTGDGAGILTQIPDAFFRAVVDFPLPGAGSYAAGTAFLPADAEARESAVRTIEEIAADEGLTVLGWRDVPTDVTLPGPSARAVMPFFRQIFVASPNGESGLALDRLAFCLRKRAEHEARVYFPSLSSRTIVYKGMLTPMQVERFFPDLTDERYETAISLVHSRFSTNTFPSWPLAHPYRYVAHNGEINTVKGNRNWMRAREAMLATANIPGELSRLFPICDPDGSDTASFDETLELLHLAGRKLPHAVLMMIPEAWENHTEMDPARRAFYEFHSTLMEAWDGPASITFSDGTLVGAVLDRNGLRPGRFWVTADGLVVLASEAGVLDIAPEQVVRKGRLQPGRMFLIDTALGKIIEDDEIKAELAAELPYEDWLHAGLVRFEELPARSHEVPTHEALIKRQQTFGYTEEELRIILTPMAATGAEPIGSMGTDTPVAVLSEKPRLLFDYFSQLFAQVTNPPLDAIREELVTSLASTLGPEGNLLDPGPASCRQLVLPYPVIDNDELAKIIHINDEGALPGFQPRVVSGLYEVAGGGEALLRRLEEIRAEVSAAIRGGARIIVLSDRGSSETLAPIPSLLLTGAVHHHLIAEKTRTRVGLVIETGEAREAHHMALLIGYGAGAINPYLAIETVEDMVDTGVLAVDRHKAVRNLIKAYGKGVLKIMSKMGVSTVASYTGAQIFEALGLGREVVDACFTGTTSRLGGIGFDVLAQEVALRHRRAYPRVENAHRRLEVGGEYQWRREGEPHLFNPETVFKLQHATRSRRYEIFKEYTGLVDSQAERLMTLRGLFRFREGVREPVPIDEVEPVSEIVKRFSTGAMSYGSISMEAHETLAIAMNRLGAKSNTGEGGEDPERLYDPTRRSAIKQVASGRFGVTSEYLVNADDLQIKMAQGAKPGEGGQLPGHKVYPWIAKTRHSTPGVGLISPPPHHDIYSIEDLAQLIHDLKNSNPAARVHVKLVAEVGVGTVAAGVSKAHADVVLISGHDGGTGASPLTSLKHAGAPWELGLAETQQTLLLNGLRDRIVVQVDGQLKTGRDVVIAALLGAEEYGFATAPLVVSGCVMMRVCHLDTCPVGVATQNPELRRRFSGKPEFVVNFFEFIAEEIREYLAELGFRSLDEAIGHAELLDTTAAENHWKASGLDLAPILHQPELPADAALRRTVEQDHGLDKALDNTLIQLAEGALKDGSRVTLDLPIRNVNRTVGTMLGHEVTKRYGGAGLPDNTIDVRFTGSAGNSFGAFLPRGVTLRLTGDANDYVGKGLSGGRIAIQPHDEAPLDGHIIAGNVALYGATSGEAFIRGVAGERFCVRNSGATAVVEGVGDHGCEYMTGGRVVVLGPTGRNFAAGMSGGVAYLLDLDVARVNREMVEIEELTEADSEALREVVEAHLAETGSTVAKTLVADWDPSRFSKIMPTDYKRVLRAAESARLEGRDIDEAVMTAAVQG
ncbi:glutamate synthase (NADPH/NADH) large chain [Streptosporangium becharense]|uniref:Glutamate synthase (NADPH/NADH) large chain n=1 Tax=Streptosporangium becharense TaxID=1816182 RepID=A0A7W9ICN0_9ACTN|nr:glutamate synthase large subunit [Streptosporangium becharense]MBB2912923.1 glutamate synthase (NADPH/NADH) large chain [Streptosporangium becharense]MBB5818252.1 glutamate synthase (NADPH/NADH) large chain [Streptosporangium becharense]